MTNIWEKLYKEGMAAEYPNNELMEQISGLKIKGKVLDLGCGVGANLEFLKKRGFKTYGIDISETACKKAKKKCVGEITCGNATKLPYPDNFFDLVTDVACLYVLKRKDILKAIEEVKRVLKPNGYFLSFMYFYGTKRVFAGTGHYYLLKKNEIKKIFKDFKIIQIKEITQDYLLPKKKMLCKSAIILCKA